MYPIPVHVCPPSSMPAQGLEAADVYVQNAWWLVYLAINRFALADLIIDLAPICEWVGTVHLGWCAWQDTLSDVAVCVTLCALCRAAWISMCAAASMYRWIAACIVLCHYESVWSCDGRRLRFLISSEEVCVYVWEYVFPMKGRNTGLTGRESLERHLQAPLCNRQLWKSRCSCCC